MSSILRHLAMNNGLKIPSIGLGTFGMTGDSLKTAIDYALCIGYRHIDTAMAYGNEIEIGLVVNDRIRSGKLRRNNLFLTTKVPSVYMARESTVRSAERSLENLRLKYVDMLLIHQPWGNVNRGNGDLRPVNSVDERELHHYNLLETWSAMEDVYIKNWSKGIGLSNFNPKQICDIWNNSSVKPSNLQLEVHAYWQQNELLQLCKMKNIVVTAYSPLGAPFRPKRKNTDPILLADPLIKELARQYRKSPGQILLNFLVKKQIGVLPKSQNMDRLKENIDIFSWELSQADCERVEMLNGTFKYLTFDWAQRHPEFDVDQPF